MIVRRVVPKPPVYTLIHFGKPTTKVELREINQALTDAGFTGRFSFDKGNNPVWSPGALIMHVPGKMPEPVFVDEIVVGHGSYYTIKTDSYMEVDNAE